MWWILSLQQAFISYWHLRNAFNPLILYKFGKWLAQAAFKMLKVYLNCPFFNPLSLFMRRWHFVASSKHYISSLSCTCRSVGQHSLGKWWLSQHSTAVIPFIMSRQFNVLLCVVMLTMMYGEIKGFGDMIGKLRIHLKALWRIIQIVKSKWAATVTEGLWVMMTHFIVAGYNGLSMFTLRWIYV